VRYKKVAILASLCVLNGAIARCCKQVPPDRGKLVILVGEVCVQHSSEARVTVLLWPFVAARCYETGGYISLNRFICMVGS